MQGIPQQTQSGSVTGIPCRKRVGLFLPLLLASVIRAQTSCANEHQAVGAFICYPNPSENRDEAKQPSVFHLSAQANAGTDKGIRRYRIWIDDKLLYDNQPVPPIQKLSIEMNLKAPVYAGSHTLRFLADGAGETTLKGLELSPLKTEILCDPLRRFDPRICQIVNLKGSLEWSVSKIGQDQQDPFAEQMALMERYGSNLKSIEADVADAIAVDATGNLYTATHHFNDVEVRRYNPVGSIVYDSLIQICEDGLLSITGLAIDISGRPWIAGNTTGCSTSSIVGFTRDAAHRDETRGFVFALDPAKLPSTAPAYMAQISDVDNRVTAIRLDKVGNVYLTGVTNSPNFPHQFQLEIPEVVNQSKMFSFVVALNTSGSGLRWSTLLPNVELNALALDGAGDIYVTGRASFHRNSGGEEKMDDAIVAELSDQGRRVSYLAGLGGSGSEEGRAIAVNASGSWIYVTGVTDSADFPVANETGKNMSGIKAFTAALQPCTTGRIYTKFIRNADDIIPATALNPILDSFAAVTSNFGVGALTPVQQGGRVAAPCVSLPRD